ncbi:unnamed protein product [Phytophthora lilii]|uniref:Unnamed protein product n=1 Tax=Phytophthora lilii TaxID=2077276 RepID=A0A9W6TS17_9STRA|nr:unnamed protein product [Phytophthora lilii]
MGKRECSRMPQDVTKTLIKERVTVIGLNEGSYNDCTVFFSNRIYSIANCSQCHPRRAQAYPQWRGRPKTYVAGLRINQDSDSLCGGSLITPTRVLTASHCAIYGFNWVSIGEHYRNGTEVGEQIKIVSLMSHPNYSENVQYADDFMVVELERPSKYKPVKLAAADDSDLKAGKMATTMGWGTNADTNRSFSYELQRVDVPLASDEGCAAYATVNSSMVCAGGIANHDSCEGDSGGPLIVLARTCWSVS